MAVWADCVAKAYYIFLFLLILAKVFHSNKDEKLMTLSKKRNEAWNKNDAYGWVNLLYDDHQFTFHSSGNVMNKVMAVEGMMSSRENESIKKIRCDFENGEILVAN